MRRVASFAAVGCQERNRRDERKLNDEEHILAFRRLGWRRTRSAHGCICDYVCVILRVLALRITIKFMTFKVA
eukprot:357516-Chlamydomonas_euryale.AAC.24